MTAFTNHFAFEFKTGLRNSALLLMNYLFPIFFYVMVGGIFTKINPTFTQALIPAMVTMAAMTSCLLGLPGPQVEAREAGIFRSFKINGVPALSILIVPVLTTIFHAVIVSTIVALTAGPIFGATLPSNWPAFIGISLLGICTFGAIGTLIGVVSSSSRSTIFLSQAIFLPSMILGGMMMPIDLLPESVRSFSSLLPTSHIMQAMTGLAFGKTTIFNPASSILILACSLLLAFGLAIYLFNWDSRNQARRGHPLMGLLVVVPYLIGMFLK